MSKKISHYVYLLINENTGMKYIGKRSADCLPDEDVEYMSSSKHVPKEECDKIVLEEFGSSEEAVAYEIELHNRFDVAKNENFYNRAKQTATGFDRTGATGYKHTDEAKLALSKLKSGVARSEEACKKISEGKNGTPSPLIGIPRSVEVINKIKKTLKGRKPPKLAAINAAKKMSKPVLCTTTGTAYSGVRAAARELGLNHQNIIKSCKTGSSTSGLSFTYDIKENDK